MKYVNKAGQVYKGSKPEGMSDDQYHQMMTKKGYKKSEGHGSTSPDPKKDRKEPANRGTPNAGYSSMSKSENQEGEEEVEVTALAKALTRLNEYALQGDTASARESLLEKAMKGEISEEENAQLRSILAGEAGEEAEVPLAKSVTAQFDPDLNETFAKSIDVSEYLGEMHTTTKGAVEMLADVIEKSDVRNHEFQVLLAKSVVQIGAQVDELSKALDTWGEATPARGRAARTKKEAVVQKSFAGQANQGEDRISKSEVLDLLERMHTDSLQKGQGGIARCGEDLQMAIAKYEQTMKISRPLVEELKVFRGSGS